MLDTISRSAAVVCGADDATVLLLEDGLVRVAAHYGPIARSVPEARALARTFASGRSIVDRRPVHIRDIMGPDGDDFAPYRATAQQTGYRTLVAVPMLRGDEAIGSLSIRNHEVRPFTDKQIALVKTFADQAVIAIQNARLFTELQQRTAELGRSVDQLRALGEVGQAVSSTLNLDAVLQAIVTRAAQLAGTRGASIWEYDELTEVFHLRATNVLDPEIAEILRASGIRRGEGALGQAALTRAPVQIPDISVTGRVRGTAAGGAASRGGRLGPDPATAARGPPARRADGESPRHR